MRPRLDVNKVLHDKMFRAALILVRRAYVVDDYGRTQVTEVIQKIGGVIRPASQKDLERLPEGDRDHGFVKLLTETPLTVGSDEETPDEIELYGRRWIVRTVDNWAFGRGFYSALCEEKPTDPPPAPDIGPDDPPEVIDP